MEQTPCIGCFWWESFGCDGVENSEEFEKCNKKITFDNPKFQELFNKYDAEVQEALEPLKEKWKKNFEEYKGE